MLDAATAAAKLLQWCPTLCDPIDGSPPGSSVPGILQARTLEWVAIAFSNAWKWKVKVKSLNHVWLLATPWTVAHQAPLSMRFSRQEYRSGVPFEPNYPQDFSENLASVGSPNWQTNHIYLLFHSTNVYWAPVNIIGTVLSDEEIAVSITKFPFSGSIFFFFFFKLFIYLAALGLKSQHATFLIFIVSWAI